MNLKANPKYENSRETSMRSKEKLKVNSRIRDRMLIQRADSKAGEAWSQGLELKKKDWEKVFGLVITYASSLESFAPSTSEN